MSCIEVSWEDDSESTLLIVFHDGWTGDSFIEMIQRVTSLVDRKPYPVHIFANFQGNILVPPLVIGIINGAKKYFTQNIGLVVVITQSPIIKYIYETIKPLLVLDYTIIFADDLEEAHLQLSEYKNNTGRR